eukprot:TRINITY_DN29_c0_g1_i12.p3 TRINITY_DN29_c0_g1~~TRINITY_DN29_c0_g1_i12.p3  ORF type:complete len:139 (+),score=15.36 TRINITY_DN29_c0_g1_i12:143-559(+)
MVKKATQENINTKLQLVMRSGKALLGFKSTVKSIRNGKAKLILIANNCPALRKSQIEYYCMLAKVRVYPFTGNNVDLGTACGKYHRVSTLAITDPGDSDILTAEQIFWGSFTLSCMCFCSSHILHASWSTLFKRIGII